jgi:Uma2 family endonuclease
MNSILLTFKDVSKSKFLLDFLATLDYIEISPAMPQAKLEVVPILPTKENYTIQDIRKIEQNFPKNHQWVYDDLVKHFPTDSNIRVEILNHKLFIMPSPEALHQNVTGNLCTSFKTFNKTLKLGKVIISPFDVLINAQNVLIPDIVFVSVARQDILDGKKANGAPDLVVEVWSPSNKKKEREEKKEAYARNGVTEFWEIYPKQERIVVQTLNAQQEYEVFSEAKKSGKVLSKVLEGLEIDVEDIFVLE